MTTRKRKKRTPVSPEVEQEVRNLLSKPEKRNITGKELKAEIEKTLIEKYNLKIDLTIRTYQNLIGRNLPYLENIINSGLDNNWHLGMLKDNPLPPQIVKRILSIQKNNQSRITVRVIYWINLLSETFKDDNKLYRIALSYALWEIYCAVRKEPFDTTPLDKELSRKGEVSGVFRELLRDRQKADCIKASLYQFKGLGESNHFEEFLSKKEV